MPPARAFFYLVTFVAIGLTGRALLGKTPSIAIASAFAIAYVAVVLLGVLFLRLRMFVDAVTRGPRNARGVALTFDDGPHPKHTRAVLDALDKDGAKATFFLIGKKAEKHPDVVKEIVARGHGIGLHSYAHDRLMALRSARRVRADLEKG